MLISTRQKINHHNVIVHISGQVLSQVPFTKYLGVFIDQNLTWQKHSESMSFRGLGGSFIVYIACSLYLSQSYFNCIVVLYFLFLTIVILCGLLQLHYFQNLWSEYMPDLLVT